MTSGSVKMYFNNFTKDLRIMVSNYNNIYCLPFIQFVEVVCGLWTFLLKVVVVGNSQVDRVSVRLVMICSLHTDQSY